MKTLFLCAFGLASLASASAADPESLKFGGERIGVPPLSLAESLTSGARFPQFRFALPAHSDVTESPGLSPKLLPHSVPDMLRKSMPHRHSSPQVSRDSGMPIITPSDAVDYAMTIVPPDPRIDFKIVIKEPDLPAKTQPEPAK